MSMKLIRAILPLLLLLVAFAGYSQTRFVRNDSGAIYTRPDDIANKYAKLLDVPPDSIRNVRLYSIIEQYSDTPYKFGGSDLGGIDCSGFSFVIEQLVYGITLPHTTAQQAKLVEAKSISQLKEGDLVFLKLGGTTVNHVGVYLQNGFFVHATSNLGVVLDSINDSNIQQHFVVCGSVSAAK
jgi:probable lipoprotein NlpC